MRPPAQVLALVHANAAQTEMDAVALAAVLAPCVVRFFCVWTAAGGHGCPRIIVAACPSGANHQHTSPFAAFPSPFPSLAQAWKPPLKQAGGPPGGALLGLRKTLSLNRGGAAAAPGDAAAAAAGDGQQGGDDAAAAHHPPAGEPVPLDDAELEGVVTVLQHMIASAAAPGSGF